MMPESEEGWESGGEEGKGTWGRGGPNNVYTYE
jgi:hypothetical protein